MWFVNFIKSSIGKKVTMATSGLLLLLFLCAHAAGNATIYMSRAIFQGYADELHSHPLIVIVFSLGLTVIFLLHIGFGLYLSYENWQVSKSRYAVTTRTVKEKNVLAARTMPYSGLFILLFLLIHIAGFVFRPEEVPIALTVKEYLSGFFYGLFYVVAFCVLALHLSHGFWSMLQTIGGNHPRYNTLIDRLTYIVPAFFLLLFGGIAIYFMTGMGANF